MCFRPIRAAIDRKQGLSLASFARVAYRQSAAAEKSSRSFTAIAVVQTLLAPGNPITARQELRRESQPMALGTVVRSGEGMRAALESGDMPFRKAYIRLAVDRIQVDHDVIRIVGNLATLEQAIAGRQTV